jgi:thiol-disulfide isomerase/thioredoxin
MSKHNHRNLLQLFLLVGSMLICSFQSAAYNITIKIQGAKNQKFLLGYYYGDKQFVRDSATTDANGKMVFKGKEKLEGGIYMIASHDKRLLFDFILSEQEFTLETDSLNYVANMKVKNSLENEVFFAYSQYSSERGSIAGEIEKKFKEAKERGDEKQMEKLLNEWRAIDKEVDDYRKMVMQKYPHTLIASIFKMMQPIDVPEPPLLPNGAKDSVWQFFTYRQMFTDNINFQDDRLCRTPVFHSRIEQYITKLTPQIPDSIAEAAFLIIDRAQGQAEMSKWLIYWITNYYETSKYMGMDAVFVKMVDRYYANKERTPWVDEVTRVKITARADQLRYTLVGVKPLNLYLPDTNMKYQRLFDIKAEYTMLVFWDPHCGHCKEELPKILDYYNKVNTGKGIKSNKKLEVYALGSTADYPNWKKYIDEKKLPWINVHDPYKESNYHRYYDINSTPVIYLLNKDKKIVGKRLSAEQAIDFIEKGLE